MEEKTIKFLTENKDLVLKEVELFDYKVKSEKYGRIKSVITVVREEKSYNIELDNLEKQYKKHRYLPFYYPLGAAALAFILVNVLFAIFFANKSLAGDIWYAFIIPAALLLIASVYLLFYRFKQVENYQIIYNKESKEILAKIKEIKQKFQ